MRKKPEKSPGNVIVATPASSFQTGPAAGVAHEGSSAPHATTDASVSGTYP